MIQSINIAQKTNYWLIRPGINNICYERFKQDSVVAIGWDRIKHIGDVGELLSIDSLKHLVWQVYGDLFETQTSNTVRKRKVSDIANKIFRFTYAMQVDDIVVCPGDYSVLIGRVAGGVRIQDGKYPSGENIDEEYIGSLNKIRDVRWIKEIPRDKLEPNIKLELRVIHGISQICNEQVITEINRSMYDLYSYNDFSHSIFRINSQKEIDFEKYANFISCFREVYENLKTNDERISFKTNINSPGPIEFISKTDIVFRVSQVMRIVLKDGGSYDEVDEELIGRLEDKYGKYDYDDYDFPCGGSV